MYNKRRLPKIKTVFKFTIHKSVAEMQRSWRITEMKNTRLQKCKDLGRVTEIQKSKQR